MFLQCSKVSFTIDQKILKKFVSSCHWEYFRKYNIIGHHNLGWGFAYTPENNSNSLVIKRDLNPIYSSDWKGLSIIKTRFLVVHARKSFPWDKNFNDIHPISVKGKYHIVHNGIIKKDSFPRLKSYKLEKIKKNTNLDTRKYLCYILDEVDSGKNLKQVLETVFSTIKISAGANAFLFNQNECNVITYHNSNFNGRHTTLFIDVNDNLIIVSTSPITPNAREIENKSLIRINLQNLLVDYQHLEF